MEGLPRTTVISTGQHILIEGDDEDNPYVARVLRLFGDGEDHSVLLGPVRCGFLLGRGCQTLACVPDLGRSVAVFGPEEGNPDCSAAGLLL